jgi:hypothetical protein
MQVFFIVPFFTSNWFEIPKRAGMQEDSAKHGAVLQKAGHGF